MIEVTYDGARHAFNEAVRALADHDGSSRRAVLIEAVVYSSRMLADDEAPMESDVSIALANLVRRFGLFCTDTRLGLERYSQARETLQALFF